MADHLQPQIPAEMREFAERSVIQARKAFEGFMGAVQKTTETVESAAGAGMKDVGSKAVAFAQTNVNAAFDLAEKLVHAKDIQEVLSLQAEYLKQQMEAVQAQAREMGEAVQKAAGVKK
jgi:phasin